MASTTRPLIDAAVFCASAEDIASSEAMANGNRLTRMRFSILVSFAFGGWSAAAAQRRTQPETPFPVCGKPEMRVAGPAWCPMAGGIPLPAVKN
ncbi:hypothetical protein MBSD_n1617 [Mizugakiibacter sediminis]|uniref:Uncharacterized protein n=1 Tax=Mizugakiibacter sediminis TaxID=1475481 RepID=A0A0K8QN67_9GAMM|nr:hypothetical protein MBSD_n1617 [Mizugakiibacter sediminis]